MFLVTLLFYIFTANQPTECILPAFRNVFLQITEQRSARYTRSKSTSCDVTNSTKSKTKVALSRNFESLDYDCWVVTLGRNTIRISRNGNS